MGDESRGGGLAVGAGDRDEGRVRRDLRPLTTEQLDIADDLDTGLPSQLRRPVRLGMGQRHAGREDEGRELRPVGIAQIACLDAFGIGFRHLRRIVVAGDDTRSPLLQGKRRRQPGTAKTEEGERFACEGGDGSHAHYRSLRVDRPTSASTTAMIQNRITTCGSVQPSCSKWWWMGAILKTRFPVSLNEATWMITDMISSTNSPPTMARTISCLAATAIVPRSPPRASEPVSPMKIWAGGALNQRKPMPAPISAPQITASSPVPGTKWICR